VILLDTNVLIDAFDPSARLHEWAFHLMRDGLLGQRVAINPVILAEGGQRWLAKQWRSMGLAEQTDQSGQACLIQAALLRIHALGRQGLLAPAWSRRRAASTRFFALFLQGRKSLTRGR
jgi:hypothetical protein